MKNLNKMSTDEDTFTKKLIDYHKRSDTPARGSGAALDTVSLRSAKLEPFNNGTKL